MQQPETRPSLMLRLKDRRNDLAWREFATAYEPFLAYLIRRANTPERHVADVTQQLLLAVARDVDGWTSDGQAASFRRWLNRVARHVAIRYLTLERRQIGGQGGSDFLDQIGSVPDSAQSAEIERRYESELVLWAAEQIRGQFHETSWKAFWQTEIEGRSVAEVAGELGVSAGSIYMSRGRIIARLRAKIASVEAE